MVAMACQGQIVLDFDKVHYWLNKSDSSYDLSQKYLKANKLDSSVYAILEGRRFHDSAKAAFSDNITAMVEIRSLAVSKMLEQRGNNQAVDSTLYKAADGYIREAIKVFQPKEGKP